MGYVVIIIWFFIYFPVMVANGQVGLALVLTLVMLAFVLCGWLLVDDGEI